MKPMPTAVDEELSPDHPREWRRSILCGVYMAVGFVVLVLSTVALAHLLGWKMAET